MSCSHSVTHRTRAPRQHASQFPQSATSGTDLQHVVGTGVPETRRGSLDEIGVLNFGAAASWSLLGAMVAVLERGLVRARASLAELGAALYAPANLIDTDSLVDWKDDPRQTQDNVVAVLDQAAAGYEDNCAVLELSLN